MRDARSLTIVLTGDCNLRCDYCYAQARTQTTLDWNALRCAMDRTLSGRRDGIEVSFTGGEPLLAFHSLRKAIEYAARAYSSVRPCWKLQTNGLLIDEAILSFLEQHSVAVHLSFDGNAAAQQVRGRGTFVRLDRLLTRWRLRHPRHFERRLTIAMTLSPSTVPYLANSIRYFLGKQVTRLSVAPAHASGGWQIRQLDELRRQFDLVTDECIEHYDRTLNVPLLMFRKLRPDRREGARELKCDAGDGRCLTVDVDGDVYGCLLAARSYRTAPSVVQRSAMAVLHAGPITSRDLARRVEAMSHARSECECFRGMAQGYSSYRRCADCEFLGRCHVCPLATRGVSDAAEPNRIPDFICAFNQVSLGCRDRFPCQPDVYALLTGGRHSAGAR
jgi:sulfatase maturation enzyme AslB (radical SAM superfamily)